MIFSRILEIKRIEAVTVKKFGYVYLNIGKSPTEDYFVVHLRRGGQYIEKMKYLYG